MIPGKTRVRVPMARLGQGMLNWFGKVTNIDKLRHIPGANLIKEI